MSRLTRERSGQHVTFFDAYPHVHGGAQRMMALAAERLPERGWRTDFVLPGEGAVRDHLLMAGVETTVVPVPRALGRYGRTTTGARAVLAAVALPRYWVRLARSLRSHRGPVHIDDHRGLLLAGPAAALARRPVVWHIHGIGRSPMLNQLGGRLADLVIVPARRVAAVMPGIERRRPVHEVRYCVEPGRTATRSTPAGQLVVAVGRLHPDKGYDVLMEAVAAVRRTLPDVRVVVAGGPQEGYEAHAEHLVEQRRQLGLDEVVELAGYVDRPADLLAEAAVFVQPSREQTELLPIAVMEALCSGLPVVASDVGAVQDLVTDGVNGLLVRPGDGVELAGALQRVLEDRALAEQLGLAAAERARVDFDPERMLDGLVEAYAAVTTPTGRTPPG